jgi:hypothetical protein
VADPENHTLHVLRDIRGEMCKLSNRVDEQQKRLNSMQQAIHGESVLGRYSAAEFDQRTSALEKRSVRPRKPK